MTAVPLIIEYEMFGNKFFDISLLYVASLLEKSNKLTVLDDISSISFSSEYVEKELFIRIVKGMIGTQLIEHFRYEASVIFIESEYILEWTEAYKAFLDEAHFYSNLSKKYNYYGTTHLGSDLYNIANYIDYLKSIPIYTIDDYFIIDVIKTYKPTYDFSLDPKHERFFILFSSDTNLICELHETIEQKIIMLYVSYVKSSGIRIDIVTSNGFHSSAWMDYDRYPPMTDFNRDIIKIAYKMVEKLST